MAETIRKNVDLDILDYYDTKIKDYVDDKVGTGGLTIDTVLSDTSTNPVQNKVIKAAIDDKADKTTATTDTDGLMSASDKTKLDSADDTYALKSKYGDTKINVGRRSGTTVGAYSTAEGNDTIASGSFSHAEGLITIASGIGTHTEGRLTQASGDDSHAGGYSAIASGKRSFSHGNQTKTTHDDEIALGRYNVSNEDTLFSIGDGTADDARHNAFEITTTGGKLHDKDIATIDDIPTSLPADGGNADKANAIVDYADANRIVKLGYAGQGLAPSQVMQFAAYTESTGDEVKIKDVSVENVKKVLGFWTGSDLSDANDAPEGISFAPMTGCANAPFDFWATILTLGGDVNSNYRQQIAFPWGRTDSYIMPRYRVKDSGVWEGWRTCGDIKPYITGTASKINNEGIVSSGYFYTYHGFIPSAVFYFHPTDRTVFTADSFDSNGFYSNKDIKLGNGSAATEVEYIIFK